MEIIRATIHELIWELKRNGGGKTPVGIIEARRYC